MRRVVVPRWTHLIEEAAMSEQHRIDLSALTHAASEALSVRRVFGEAYEAEGALIIPVAKIAGGNAVAGGRGSAGFGRPGDDGDGTTPEPPDGPHHTHGPHGLFDHGQSQGGGDAGVYLARTKPLGVYVVDVDGVHWRPAVDLNRVILGGQIVGAVALLALARTIHRRRR
jgi:uncharacterized spore protein YtfJ